MKAKRVTWQQVIMLLCSLFLLIIPATSCDDTTPSGTSGEDPSGYLLVTSGCKAFALEAGGDVPGPDQDCFEYSYDRSGELSITHINAGFNCCPGEITADIDITNHVITITEHEEMQLCRCNCLFDVEYRIENIPPGLYTIRFVEPYTEEGDEPLECMINLQDDPAGSCCVTRDHYPWDSGIASEPSGILVDLVGCKDFITLEDTPAVEIPRDCIEYEYRPWGLLLLKHVNAGFNCCPLLDTQIMIEDDTITITETELEGNCDCLCLFDPTYQIVNLPPGVYAITVVEPYLQPGDEALEFTVDLNAAPAGGYCVERAHYPW